MYLEGTENRSASVKPLPRLSQRRPVSPAEQKRRRAHGKAIGAKVAAAYRKLTEAK